MIKIIKSDIRNAGNQENIIIAHICNNKGGWGAGVSGVIGEMYPEAEQLYRSWNSIGKINSLDLLAPNFELGNTQIIKVNEESNIYVANMIAQNGYKYKGKVPFSMQAMITALTKVLKYAKINKLDVHMPKIGSGLGGGDWNEIFETISNLSDSHGVNIVVYSIEE